ncbi:tRNA 5-methylaminomethyl-2-thiouridine synthase [Arsukibacterium ikkense]|uniref:tRNA 5-methylaminomethyl-2-thiouridine biosynthesis bifunctional protein MnmC n=1 Tax=Arsukibacterium ikkense TaxID=336831 RepID=A0A0M2V9C8_9GAMM|nr:bifunctional tRNA (5-methylaminomethyl-2-thiouridine)(34)-methyltransferase MnmD/FAD-dependent 5-carboxymethylaminomethyl-2-thiouridine(34) oxidoreductase MnmC [Arsukibacterium ikkense]KKO47462.1 tRNA 5-methylaminomethyl-2-thiouridine synthase [Arsukibacterium ikkense]
MPSLKHANIHFNQQGTPVATDFDDIYFSNDGGLAETDYVFLQQNGLPARWQQHPATHFHIIETGFGTGANFLLSWQKFRQYRQQHAAAQCRHLYFSSFEKYPLSRSDLTLALQVHTELSEHCQLLLAQYPPAVAGCHRLTFDDGTVVLDLWLGDVNELLPQLPVQNQADAFYLDGFAPGKNPQMWQPQLFSQMARLSCAQTTVATFTCAGLVKRGLQDNGFAIKKVKGFGRKREMLTANFSPPTDNAVAASGTEHVEAAEKVAIVGGGIASLCLALQLIAKGIATELICADAEVAQGASHNLQGAVYPNLHPELTQASLLHCQAFYFARHFYQQLATKGMVFAMQWCGVLHLATTPALALRQQKLVDYANWPAALVYPVNATEASQLAGVELAQGGIFLPQAGWLSPQQFCQAALVQLQQSALFNAKFSCRVTGLSAAASQAKEQSQWSVQYLDCEQASQTHRYSCVVLASGANITDFSQSQHLPVNRVRGQVSHISCASMQALNTVLCHKGYITPALDGLHAVGATFDRNATEAYVAAADNQENLALVNHQLLQPAWFSMAQVHGARAAFRATVPDHLPLLGKTGRQQGLYVLGGLGARGILLAPLLAETLACEIAGQPQPMANVVRQAIAADRFNKPVATV